MVSVKDHFGAQDTLRWNLRTGCKVQVQLNKGSVIRKECVLSLVSYGVIQLLKCLHPRLCN